MSLAQRFERRLEGLVGGAFARVFKGQVEPVEVGSALQREAADKRSVMERGQVLAPNRYRVTLSPTDHGRLAEWEVQLTNSLAELLQEYLDENRWTTIGDVEVYLARDDQLHTGVFGVASRMDAQAAPRRRPHDSLSLPAVPGPSGGAYQQPHPQQPYAPAQPYGPGPGYPPASPPAAVPYAPSYAPSPAAYGPGPVAYAPVGAGAAAGPPLAADPYQQQSQPQAPNPPPPSVRGSGPSLVVDQTNQQYHLRVGSNVVGRGTDADLQLLDQGISRRHLDIQFDGNFATAYDLGSTNGSAINGHEVGSQVLRHGDVLRIGHTRLVFHQEQV